MTQPLTRDPHHARIVWLSHGYGYGGDLMYFSSIFEGFVKLFPNTVIFVEPETIVRNQSLKDWLRPLGFLQLRVRRRVQGTSYESEMKLPKLSLIWRLIRLRPELVVILEFTPTALIGFFLMKGLFRRRVLLLIESDPAFRGANSSGWWLKVKSFVARNSDRVMTCNALGRAYLKKQLGVSEEKVLVAPYLTSEVRGIEAAASGWEERKNANGPLVLLFANSLTDRKGIIPLLSALLLIDADQRYEIRLRIAGDGPLTPVVQRFVDENHLGNIVTLLGKISYQDIAAVYASADVFISPTMGDYRSLTGFEALSAGLPIIISQYDGAHEEVVRQGENGFLIDPINPQDIASKIEWFIQNRGRIEGMRISSRKIAERFTFDAIISNLNDAVLRALT